MPADDPAPEQPQRSFAQSRSTSRASSPINSGARSRTIAVSPGAQKHSPMPDNPSLSASTRTKVQS